VGEKIATIIAVALVVLWHGAALVGLLQVGFPRMSRSVRRMIGITLAAVAFAMLLTLLTRTPHPGQR
jgi:hypothetical protein